MEARLKKIVKHYYKGNVLEFAKALEFSPPSVYRRMKFPEKSTSNFFTRILELHPKISAEWLFRGNGEMLLDKSEQIDKKLDEILKKVSV